MSVMQGFELDSPFCGNPDCRLHVRAIMPGVIGRGNWAKLVDARVVGRHTYCGVFLCDKCLREWRAVSAFLSEGTEIMLTHGR